MLFKSTRAGTDERLSHFKEAALRCLPEDGGLFVPAAVPDLRQFFLHMDAGTSYGELAATIASNLLDGELNPLSANRFAEDALSFEPELTRLDEKISILKLYHGPTGSFKDFGIAFLASILEEIRKDSGPIMVVSTEQGDTGCSIAHAFSKHPEIVSVILYPQGPIHAIDEQNLRGKGGNIIPIQIKGTLDDCTALLRELIRDRPFSERYCVTSANAMNPGRLLPQAFYYLYAFVKLKKLLSGNLFFSVPCGNFGNLIAGLYAWKFGMPVSGFIAAQNRNNPLGSFLEGKALTGRRPISTNTPALDVSYPVNYERLASLYDETPLVMRNMVYPIVIEDEQTNQAIENAWKKYGVMLDPHGALALAAARQHDRLANEDSHYVVLATGHPAKYANLIENATGSQLNIPPRLENLRKKTEAVAVIPPQLDLLESVIATSF
jgi:threonine synthase